jgi:hypothetical protein
MGSLRQQPYPYQSLQFLFPPNQQHQQFQLQHQL